MKQIMTFALIATSLYKWPDYPNKFGRYKYVNGKPKKYGFPHRLTKKFDVTREEVDCGTVNVYSGIRAVNAAYAPNGSCGPAIYRWRY